MDTTRALFAIDDQFDSYTSAANLFSLQYEMYLHEQGKAQTNLYRMTGDGDPAPPDVTAVRVVPGTRDAISFLFNLRAADWQRTPELARPASDGGARSTLVADRYACRPRRLPGICFPRAIVDDGKELTICGLALDYEGTWLAICRLQPGIHSAPPESNSRICRK